MGRAARQEGGEGALFPSGVELCGPLCVSPSLGDPAASSPIPHLRVWPVGWVFHEVFYFSNLSFFLQFALKVMIGRIAMQVCLFFSASCFVYVNVRSSYS